MALLAAAVLPIAVAANILRVMVLAAATVHLGPDAAQGWVHDVAGFGVFVVALLLLVALDKWGQVNFRTRPLLRPSGSMREDSVREKGTGSKINLTPFIVAVGMVGTAVAAPVLKPVADPAAAAFDLERAVPAAFAGWSIDPEVVPLPPAPDVQANLARLYRRIVARTYVNAAGERMMLTVAHGGDQSDALKAHRQEACYRAQGFAIQGLGHGALVASGRSIDVTRFLARRADRSEPVTYWFTMGDRVVLGRLERLGVQLANGLRGRVPDGLLVRVSSLDGDPARAYAAQAAFVAALVAAVPERHVARLAGAAHSQG
jgi:EpsI family protein